ncbi:unnamed protein product, partial [Musa textilis]
EGSTFAKEGEQNEEISIIPLVLADWSGQVECNSVGVAPPTTLGWATAVLVMTTSGWVTAVENTLLRWVLL